MACFELVTIADLNGGNAINLHNVNGPVPVPVPTANYDVQLQQMRQGSGGPGYRAAQLLGAVRHNTDWELSCEYVTPSILADLETKYFRQPAQPVKITNDNGLNWYVVVFQPGGLVARYNDWTTERIQVTLKFHTMRKL